MKIKATKILKMMNHKYLLIFIVLIIRINSAHSYSQCNLNGNKSAINHLNDVQLVFDTIIQDTLNADESRRYSITLKELSPLTIDMSSCLSPVTWNIFYNQTINFGNYLRQNDTQLSLACAPPGRYDFLITPIKKCTYSIIIQNKQIDENWPYLNLTKTTNIRLQNRQQRRQVIIKWDKSKLDIHAIHYCVSINTQQQQKSLCRAAMMMLMMSSVSKLSTLLSHQHTFGRDINSGSGSDCSQFFVLENLQKIKPDRIQKIDSSVVTVLCTGSKSQQILRGLQINTPYYIDVFGVHTKLNNFSFLLGSTTTWFNRTHPIPLIENKTITGRFSDLGGVSIFSFKVPSKTSTSNIRLLIIPCGGSVDLRLMKQKNKILLRKNIYKPTFITVTETNPGDRYVLRVTPTTDDDTLTVNKVEMTITSKDHFNNIPELPKNMTIVEFVSSRSCRSTTIAWFGIDKNDRKIRYCVYVMKLMVKNRDFDNIKNTNYCKINESLMEHPQFQQIHCFYREKRSNEIETLRLVGLSSRSHYYVHITASYINGKPIPYESVRVKTLTDCPRNILKQQLNIMPRNNNSSGTTKFKDANTIFSNYNSRTIKGQMTKNEN